MPGVDLNCRDVHGLTALHWAVAGNRPACVSVLSELAGLDWNVRTRTDSAGWYPLTMAVEKGRADILQIILTVPEPHLDLSVIDSRGRNIAQIAEESDRGDRQRCLELLSGDRRVDWNIKNRKIEIVQSFLSNIDAGAAHTELSGLTEMMEKKHSEQEISQMKEMINNKRSEMKAKYEEQMKWLDRLESQLVLEMEETSQEYMECEGLEIREATNIKQEMLEINIQNSVEISEPDIKQEPHIPEIREADIKQEPHIPVIGEAEIEQAPIIKQEPVIPSTRTEPELDLIMETNQRDGVPVPRDIPSPPHQSEPHPSGIYSNKETPHWVLRPWVKPANNKGNVNVERTIIKDKI